MESALLALLFDTNVGYWRPLLITIPLSMIVAGIWVYFDANERVGNGCFWGSFAFVIPVLGLPLYYLIVLVYHVQGARGPSARESSERAQLEARRKQFVMQGELERQKYLDDAEQQGGTVFNPLTGMGTRRQGHRHFADHRAEDLIQQGKYDEAYVYLKDLLALAKKENDGRAQDTYIYYIAQLPDGKDKAREAQ